MDDNIFNLMVIEQLILSNFPNFRCHKAYNGQEALHALADHKYSLVLMDCNMPVMDGFESTIKIKQTMGDQSPPIIALTAYTTEETKKRCFQAGM